MKTSRATKRDRRALGITGIGCLVIAGATSLLTKQADATPITLAPLTPEAHAPAIEPLPDVLRDELPERAQAASQPRAAEQTEGAPVTQAQEETISYAYELSRERSNDEPLLLKTSGVLTLSLGAGADGARQADAQLQSVVAWDAEGVDAVFLAEVMSTSASVSLSPAGAILEIGLPAGLSPEAVSYWKRVLGRWQTAGPAKPEYAERWRAAERNEIGTYSALYELDLEAGDGTISKVILGYKSLDDANATGHPMCESEARLTPGEHPSKIEGRDLLSTGPGSFGPEELITYSFTRMR